MAARLRLPFIEARRKTVRIVRGHGVTVPLSDEQRDTLALIRRRIQEGLELPRFCYRLNRDSTPDDLLEREGIMHLHLSPRDRNATLFLIQYRSHVVFLGVNGHEAFGDDPPGSYLYTLHRHAIMEEEERIDADDASRMSAVRAGLKPRKRPKPEPS